MLYLHVQNLTLAFSLNASRFVLHVYPEHIIFPTGNT